MLDTSGRTVNYVAVKHDITHEIALEARLQQSLKMEAVGQLAGGVAHDFNNILQVLLGYGEIAMKACDVDSPVHQSLDEMNKASLRAVSLVRQLLAFSRQQVLEMKDLDLNDLVVDLIKMIRRVIGEHITLKFHAKHDLGTICADAGQIEQLLINLCVNARDAMPEGGEITIKTGNQRIDAAFCETHFWAEPGRYVLLSVSDTGCGMDDELLGKIFDPFFTTKDVDEGTGLGLATVYGQIKQHEGLIDVCSEVGKGTTFNIYLPLTERPAATVNDKGEASVLGGTETILLAEDDEAVRQISQTILENEGYTVLATCDGEEALRVFEEHSGEIDLLLLDVIMPTLGGPAVFERTRELQSLVRVLFASGYRSDVIDTDSLLDQGLAFIQKPYQRNDLLRRVREVLDN